MKLKTSKGFTLIEVLVSMLILTFLVIGMGPGMKTAVTVYRESLFQSNSTALIGAVNTTLSDVLRYAENVTVTDEGDVLFTNTEYGLKDACFLTIERSGGEREDFASLVVLDHNGQQRQLLPEGAYPNMELADFSLDYANECFEVQYTIYSIVDPALSRKAVCTIAQINAF